MPFSPYLIIVAMLALGGAFVAGDLHRRAERDDHYGRIIAEQKVAAAGILAAETAKTEATNARNAELARTIEETNAQKAAADIARGADFDKRLRLAVGRERGRCTATSQTAPAGSGAEPAESGDPGLGGISPEAIRAVRDAGLELQRYAVACHSWALEVGR